MATDTNNPNSVMLEREARILRESLSRCRRDVALPLVDEHVRNTIKRIENDRAKPCEHIITVLYDSFVRKAPRADIEAFPRMLLAVIGEWHEGARTIDLPTLIRRETEAEAIGNLSEMDLAIALNADGEVRDRKVIADAADRLRPHLLALEQLVQACERMQVADAVGDQRMVA